MTYARVTLSDDGRNVELLLPSDVPLGELLPELLRAFRRRATLDPNAVTLTADGGGSLPWTSSLDEAGVTDGSVLRLTHRSDQVAPPVVYDMVDEAVETRLQPVPWPVGVTRAVAATVVCALLVVCAASLLTLPFASGDASLLMGIGAVVLLVVVAALPGRWGLGLPLIGTGLALGVEGVLLGSSRDGLGWWTLAPLACLATLAWFCGHRQWRHLLLSGATMLLLGAAWAALPMTLGGGPAAGALLAVTTMTLLGALPRVALSLSGIARLDDRALAGELVHRPRALESLDAAHQGLAVSVVLCALCAWRTVALLAPTTNVWALVLATLVVLLTALRSRAYPLALERVGLQVGAVLAATTLAYRLVVLAPAALWPVGIGFVVLAVAVLAGLVTRAPAHVTARLRVWAGRAEMLATVALVPVVVGMFGVYSQLSTVFQG